MRLIALGRSPVLMIMHYEKGTKIYTVLCCQPRLSRHHHHSLSNSTVEDLGPEESALGFLNHLLVHAGGWVVHQHRPFLVVDLRVHTRVSDEIDDPLLPFFLVEAQTFREVSVGRVISQV